MADPAEGGTLSGRWRPTPKAVAGGRRHSTGSRTWGKMDIKEVRAHLDQNMLARYAAVTPVSILGFSGWPLFRRRTVPDQCPLPRLAQTWHSKIEIRDQYRCLRCLLLVMCTYPFAKKELTLHLACGEGRERYFGCNLMQRKVLASSHQHLMVEAPRSAGAGVLRSRPLL